MKISELIEQLEEIKEKEGDLRIGEYGPIQSGFKELDDTNTVELFRNEKVLLLYFNNGF